MLVYVRMKYYLKNIALGFEVIVVTKNFFKGRGAMQFETNFTASS